MHKEKGMYKSMVSAVTETTAHVRLYGIRENPKSLFFWSVLVERAKPVILALADAATTLFSRKKTI